jgi:hypothetical protein
MTFQTKAAFQSYADENCDICRLPGVSWAATRLSANQLYRVDTLSTLMSREERDMFRVAATHLHSKDGDHVRK